MAYLSVSQTAEKWGISERSVRNYCSAGRIDGAFLTGKTWNIPEDAVKPVKILRKRLPKHFLKYSGTKKQVNIQAAYIIKYRSTLPIIQIILREAGLPTTRHAIFLKPILSVLKMRQ